MQASDSFAARLTRSRAALGWSQLELSSVTGVAAAQISRYESGRNVPRAEVVAKLARALGVNFDWLFFGEGPIDADLVDPPLPENMELISLDIDRALYDRVAASADQNGVTVEMELLRILREAFERNTINDFTSSHEPKRKRKA